MMLHKAFLLLGFLSTIITSEASSLLLRGSCFLAILTFVTAQDCGTCINGECISGDCECDDGYDGEDCTMPFVTCRDGSRKCYNGSECRRNRERDSVTGEHGYSCDCSKAYGVSSFAGIQCEYSATQECEIGVDNSAYKFCTNGGKCIEKVNSDIAHQGCHCVNAFEGLHCEYLKGEAPTEELALVAELQESRKKESGISGVIIMFSILISLVLIGMFAFVIYKKKRGERDTTKNEFEIERNRIEPKSEIL